MTIQCTHGPRARAPGLMLAFAAVLGLAPARAAAQAADSGSFVVLRGTDTLAVERFRRAAGHLRAELVDRIAGYRQTINARLAEDGGVPELLLEVRPASAPPDVEPIQRVHIELRGDSAAVGVGPAGNVRRQTVATQAGAVPFINLDFALVRQVVARGRRSDSGTVPLLLLAGAQTVPAQVTALGDDSVSLGIAGVAVHLAVDEAGRILGGSVPAQGLRIERTAWAAESPTAPPRDYSPPPGAPYTAREVRIPTPGGAVLAGTLTLPAGSGPFPAVVTITGSGPQERDESLPGVRGYAIFRQIADTLSRRGIAVLRADDRGIGASTGDIATATSADFADDVRALVAWLRSRPEIVGARIALLGHSEGGLIAPMVAASDPKLAGIILLAGPSRSGREILTYQARQQIEADTSLSLAARDSLRRRLPARIDSLAAGNAWIRYFTTHDPLEVAKRVRVPALVLQGANDQQVLPNQGPELAAALKAGGDRDVQLHVLPGLDHLFLNDPDGSPAGYAELPDKKVPAEVLGIIADWAAAHLRR